MFNNKPYFAAPDEPFRVCFLSREGKDNSIIFHKDGRVEANMPDADEASRLFLDYLEKNYKVHIKTAEFNGKMEATNELQKKLSDPSNVYMGILKGEMAKPTWDQICHLYPEESNDSERLRFLIEEKAMVKKQEGKFVVLTSRNTILGIGKTAIVAIDNAMEGI